jgi:hypothetical protein
LRRLRSPPIAAKNVQPAELYIFSVNAKRRTQSLIAYGVSYTPAA